MNEKLSPNENTLRQVIEYSPAAIAMFDREMRYIAYSQRFLKDYNLKSEDLIGKSHYAIFPEISDRMKEIHQRCLAGATEHSEAEPFLRQDGKIDYVQWEIQPWYNVNDEIGGIILFSEVITDLVQTEINLSETQKQMQSILDNTGSLIYVKDLEGHFIFVNREFESTFELSTSQILGKTSYDLFPKDIGDEHFQNDHRVMKSETQIIFEELNLKSDGIRTFFTTKFPLFDSSDQVYAICAISTDITDLKKSREDLNRSHAELQRISSRLAETQETERRALAKELHERVGQNLTRLNISLNLIKNRLDATTQKELSPSFDNVQHLIEEFTDQVREVMSELHPQVLEDYGLLAALRWYKDQVNENTSLSIDVEGELIEPKLSLPVAMALFRITQEAINNIIKHASATKAQINLFKFDNFIELTISDNGVGFDPNFPLDSIKPHWGQLIMKERARSIKGELQIYSQPGAGTKICVMVPKA